MTAVSISRSLNRSLQWLLQVNSLVQETLKGIVKSRLFCKARIKKLLFWLQTNSSIDVRYIKKCSITQFFQKNNIEYPVCQKSNKIFFFDYFSQNIQQIAQQLNNRSIISSKLNRMLFNIQEVETAHPRQRKIYLYQNSSAQSNLLTELNLTKKKYRFSDILKLLGWNGLRLFNAEGGQYFEEDLDYIKDKTNIYASRGEEFNPSSCFGEYTIVKELGEGGFGKVLLGEHKITKQKVAIKTIKTEMIGSAADIDNIFVEAQILKSLNHQNIVKVHKCLTLDNMQVAIIMEYLQGGELLAYVENKGKLSELQAKNFFCQMVRGILYCHQNNLIHRDLKLQNMLLLNDQQKKIKIIDFGIAGIAAHFKIQQMNTGSLNYMAPQCFSSRKDKKIDGEVDVWAMGVILFGMITGHLPFKGKNNHEKIQSIRNADFKIPGNVLAEISEQCDYIIRRCLDPNPKTRISIGDLCSHPWVVESSLPQPRMQKQKAKEKKEDLKPVFEVPSPVKSTKSDKPSSGIMKKGNLPSKYKVTKK